MLRYMRWSTSCRLESALPRLPLTYTNEIFLAAARIAARICLSLTAEQKIYSYIDLVDWGLNYATVD